MVDGLFVNSESDRPNLSQDVNMTHRKLNLTRNEIARAFDGAPPILSPGKLAKLLDLSRKTIYGWIQAGRLDGTFRKRGKHCLIWRDRVIDSLFNGKTWSEYE